MACQATDKDWEVKYKQAGQFSNPGSPALPPRQSTTGIPEPHWGVLEHQATDEDSGGRFSSPASRATLPGLPTADALECLWAALRHQATDKDWEVDYKHAGEFSNHATTPSPKPSPPPPTTKVPEPRWGVLRQGSFGSDCPGAAQQHDTSTNTSDVRCSMPTGEH